ncbi:MAG: RsmE family RNA methyltransferase [Trueperaceae bacterium]|nr:RsmE family RNA methyltransferase [Trueperaceae bacterium]
MRRHRVFVRNLKAGTVALLGAEAHHLAQVLRVGPGDPVRAFDGAGLEAEGEVVAVDPVRVELRLEPPHPSDAEPSWSLTLAVGLLKGDKLSDVIRHGTELGVVRFIPFVSRRGDVPTLSPNKLARWRRVAQEAAKQSGRSVVPDVTDATPLKDLDPATLGADLGLVADPRADATLRDHLAVHTPADGASLCCLTGPEGGFTDEEIVMLRDKGFRSVFLGGRILRAETAPVALAAALLVPEGR